MFIDTHTHIYLQDFDEDRKGIISECLNSGVNKLLLPNIDRSSIADVIKICEVYKNICYPMVGLHPCYVKDSYEDDLDFLKPLIKPIKPIAIGEIGIDLYWDKSNLEIQKKAFIAQINWAKEFKLPIVIHARDSYNEIFEVLDQVNDENLKGVFHCFSSSLKDADRILNYGGFKLGIGGVITFKNSGLDKVVKNIDIKNIVLETDSPYLTPTPFRGTRNKSSYIPIIANKLSDIYEISSEEIGNITSKNAKEIFNI
ncbi:MAG: TatD family hydrolase [Flavobacteriales bacterium]|nr:TatD family hydrolase [Flavobacteriales bacterium]